VLDFIACDANEYVYVSDPFLVVMPSGRRLIVRAYEKYDIDFYSNKRSDTLVDYYEEVINNNPSIETAAEVFKDRIKNPRKTQIDWGYGSTDLYPKGNVVRKSPDMNPGFSRESIYGR